MKKIVASLVMVGLLLVGLKADAQIKPAEASLERYKWKKRPLLLFSPSETSPEYIRQKEALQASAEGLAERGMVVIELVGQDKVYIDGALQRRRQSVALRKKFQVPAGAFAVILVGKDGTEKSRDAQPVDMGKIFSLVDQMPMRRREKSSLP
jgi:hypothetical protein